MPIFEMLSVACLLILIPFLTYWAECKFTVSLSCWFSMFPGWRSICKVKGINICIPPFGCLHSCDLPCCWFMGMQLLYCFCALLLSGETILSTTYSTRIRHKKRFYMPAKSIRFQSCHSGSLLAKMNMLCEIRRLLVMPGFYILDLKRSIFPQWIKEREQCICLDVWLTLYMVSL